MVSIKKLDETPIKLVLDLMHQYVQLQGPKSTSDPPKTPLNVVRLLCVIPQSLRLIMQFQMISRYLLYHQQCSNEEEGGRIPPPSSYVSQKPIQFRVNRQHKSTSLLTGQSNQKRMLLNREEFLTMLLEFQWNFIISQLRLDIIG